jgi:hypothetical protein
MCGNIEAITSVESDATFFHNLASNSQIRNAILEKRLFPMLVNIGETKEWGYPVDDSRKEYYPQYSLECFAMDKRYDLVLVDGRFRVACILQACLHLASGAIILCHDFWNRVEYHIVLPYLRVVDKVDTLAVFEILDYDAFTRSTIETIVEIYQYLPER